MKEKTDKLLKNKKLLIGIAICLVIVIGTIIIVSGNKTKSNTGGNPIFNKDNVNIVNSENQKIEYETFSNENVTMTIPKGWKVVLNETTNYGIRVYNPENKMYQFFSFFGIGYMNKTQTAKNFYQKYSYAWSNGFEKFPVLNPKTVTNFYKLWTTVTGNMKSSNLEGYKTFDFPYFYNFTEIDTYAYSSYIGRSNPSNVTEGIVRATFTDAMEEIIGEGLFSASIIDLKPSDQYFPLTAYNVMGITTPEYDLVNWEEILLNCVNSIKFSDSYIKATNATLQAQGDSIVERNNEISAAFSSYTSAWASRQTTYDVTRQKYSDATLGYERVYDTKTGDVYKAYNGFTSSYEGSKYQTATDEMYSKSISGYIEK